MEEIIFQKATADDVDVFLELENKVAHVKMYSAILDKEEAEKEIEDNEVYFIKKGDTVVGWTEYKIKSPGHAYLGGLVIDPAYQNQGIARRAIEFLLNKLKDIKRIDLVTHPHNSKIIRMCLSCGFVIEAWKDNYYDDGEPRLVLSLNR